MLCEFYVKLFVEKDVFSYQNNIFQIIRYVRNRHFNADDKTKKKPYKSTSPRGLLICKALIVSYKITSFSYNLDIIILFVLRFMPRSLNFVPAQLTLADFAMFFAIEIIISRTQADFHTAVILYIEEQRDPHSSQII